MTSKGQVTIPKELRERLELEAGVRLNFVVRSDGDVLLEPARLAAEPDSLRRSRGGGRGGAAQYPPAR